MMEGELGKRILDSLEDAKRWRGRMEDNLSLLSHQVAELATEVRVRAENADQRHRETSARLRDAETALRGGGASAVDVNVSQAVGAEPAASATKSAIPKTAAAAGGSGLLTWLFAGDGWQTISAALKKLLG